MNRKKAWSYLLYRHPYARRYLIDAEYRAQVSLHFGLVVNLVYAVFHLFTGIRFCSAWMGVAAIYYLLPTLMRAFLLRYGKGATRRQELRACLGGGLFLLALNVSLSFLLGWLLRRGTVRRYPSFVIVIYGGYALYRVVRAAVNFRRFRRRDHPIYAAAKALDFSVALVSSFSLQTALLSRLLPSVLSAIWDRISGWVLCATIPAVALHLIAFSATRLYCRTDTSMK